MVVTKHAVPVEDMSAEDSSVASGTSPLHEWDSGEKIPITKEKKDMMLW
ncbi:hypothetical protein HY947_00235 [Candidatus Gottesmanbacteria bacterium]|nr:hypothetical protein [Candidatus Gottesmanbacteria bacterium]